MSVGNPLLAIGDAVPARLREAREERDRKMAEALELSVEIAKLEMLLAITTKVESGEPAGPTTQGLEAGSVPGRRRRQETPEPPPAGPPPGVAGA